MYVNLNRSFLFTHCSVSAFLPSFPSKGQLFNGHLPKDEGGPRETARPQQLSVQAEATFFLDKDSRGFSQLREGRAGLGSPQGPCNLRRHPLLKKPTPRPRHTKELTFALSIPRGNERIRWDPTGVDWKVCEVAQSSFQTSSLRMGPTEPSSPNRKHLVQAIFTPTEGRPL